MTSITVSIKSLDENDSIIEATPYETGIIRFSCFPSIEDFKNNESEYDLHISVEYLDIILQVHKALA